MAIWAEMNEDFKTLLRLRTEPVAFRRLEKAEDLNKIPNVIRVKRGLNYYQIPFIEGLTDPTPILAQFYPDRAKK
jgi:hypothetical protein